MYQFDVEFLEPAVACLMPDVDGRDCTVCGWRDGYL